MDARASISEFLAAGPFAVAGASSDRTKYGNKVLRAYLQAGLAVYAVNPRVSDPEVEGAPRVDDLASLPEGVRGLSIVTQPDVTERLVEDAAKAGIRHLWMQPGAESPRAIERARELGLSVIAGGPCVLVALRFRESP
jgi:predicted CoA-binding protein